MFVKKHLPLVILIVIIVAAFWLIPPLRHVFFPNKTLTLKQEQKKEDPAEQFNRLLIANGYLVAPLDQYDNFRLVILPDGQTGAAYFQINRSVQEAKIFFNSYLLASMRLTNSTSVVVKEKKIDGGVDLLGVVRTQPLEIKVTKVSEKVSSIVITFQIHKQTQSDLPVNPKLPKNFPSDFPINGATAVKVNTKNILVFESNIIPDQNFNIYKSYFSTAPGWAIILQANEPKQPVKAIFATNKAGRMMVNIYAGSYPGSSIISLEFLSAK